MAIVHGQWIASFLVIVVVFSVMWGHLKESEMTFVVVFLNFLTNQARPTRQDQTKPDTIRQNLINKSDQTCWTNQIKLDKKKVKMCHGPVMCHTLFLQICIFVLSFLSLV